MINRKYLNVLYNELVNRLDETLFTPEQWQKIKNEKRNVKKWAAVLKNQNLLKGFVDSEGHDLDELIDIVHEGEPEDSSELSDDPADVAERTLRLIRSIEGDDKALENIREDPMFKPMATIATALAQNDLGRFDEAGNVVYNTRDTKDTSNTDNADNADNANSANSTDKVHEYLKRYGYKEE